MASVRSASDLLSPDFLAQLARFHMLASRNDEALRFGSEALAMADALGLEDVRADVLISIGSANRIGGVQELCLTWSDVLTARNGYPQVNKVLTHADRECRYTTTFTLQNPAIVIF